MSVVFSQFVGEFESTSSRTAIGLGLVVVTASSTAIERRILRSRDPRLADHFAGVAAVFALAQLGAWAIAQGLGTHGVDDGLTIGIGLPGAYVLDGLQRAQKAVSGDPFVRPSAADAFVATLLVASFWTLVVLVVAKLSRFVAERVCAVRRVPSRRAETDPIQ